MNLLAIETSTDACSVGLSLDGQLLLDHRMAPQQHGALVLPMIDALMSEAGLAPTQLDGVVFGRGPGSFTGVRIGVALTQGIALGADVGVVGISTLQSVAQGCFRQHGDTELAVCLDARMSEVYFSAFVLDEANLMQAVMDEQVIPPADMPHLPVDRNWQWAGSGAECYGELLASDFAVDASRIRADCWPMAEDLLTLGGAIARAGGLVSPEQAMPVYLRDKVAQTTVERAEQAALRKA
ncbi:tRNA (adenosine(37)-N6)-threonylcarbamoyltransferase complex dimerization subunit type 1 TsaB [Granulosicoccus antarcticus]|uniref:tRNA threonylcarbamoyladenosine biosynthesis protein TsaB n=1 Tax=Granulosicoccus antarcticus IMCC3135 TaxID=1192854 RepID=A0A2Z2NVM5_9GAMM|nr:tRNA (adenosine(37)-N6)-threonylcarbamoyltransferase complex dimerization subunit type 1 TsaB [Granulosicoccus antarcticus]ASJ75293.1 tRNA threonylcarbamoyladenosine biosynthesis protein TsaB [Granulosicoccus antarcticus IMCC3135]